MRRLSAGHDSRQGWPVLSRSYRSDQEQPLRSPDWSTCTVSFVLCSKLVNSVQMITPHRFPLRATATAVPSTTVSV